MTLEKRTLTLPLPNFGIVFSVLIDKRNLNCPNLNGSTQLISKSVNKYLQGLEKTMPKFGNGNGNVRKTKDQQQLFLNIDYHNRRYNFFNIKNFSYSNEDKKFSSLFKYKERNNFNKNAKYV